MAGRILNRRELRQQAEQAEQVESSPDTPEAEAPVAKAPAAKKAKKPAAPRKPRVAKAKVPTRMRARWGIFDGAMKQVAIFDYNQRDAADAKLADLLSRAKGTHFMQIVKEPMPLPPVPATPAVGSVGP